MDQGSYSHAQLGGSLLSATSLTVGAVSWAPPCTPPMWVLSSGPSALEDRWGGAGGMVRGMARQDGDVS